MALCLRQSLVTLVALFISPLIAAATPQPATATVPPSTEASTTAEAQEFLPDALLFYRVVACGGQAPLPAHLDAAQHAKHCARILDQYARLRIRYLEPARAFFASKQPAELPTTVVYPFGGGDLLSALITYPQAREITTMSLEHAGDPTRLAKRSSKQTMQDLQAYRAAVSGLLELHDSTTENMQKLERGSIPGQLSFHLTALAALGYEPVSLRYFSILPSGELHYLTPTEIAARSTTIAKKKKKIAFDTDFSEAFTNMELQFRLAGDPAAPLITHRHIAANLANNALTGSALWAHLDRKAEFVALTKAASYLLWYGTFTTVRDYLASRAVWMASDATGLPVATAKRNKLKQVTFGTFTGAFLEAAQGTEAEAAMVEMWAAQPKRRLPFRYGYPDLEKHYHLMITERAARKVAPPAPQ